MGILKALFGEPCKTCGAREGHILSLHAIKHNQEAKCDGCGKVGQNAGDGLIKSTLCYDCWVKMGVCPPGYVCSPDFYKSNEPKS